MTKLRKIDHIQNTQNAYYFAQNDTKPPALYLNRTDGSKRESNNELKIYEIVNLKGSADK
jgi:hypothetical protein